MITEGKYESSIAYRDRVDHAIRIETFREFDTPEEAYKVADAALRAHGYADRIHVSRGKRDGFTGAVYPVFVGEWDFNRETMTVVASLVDDDIADLPALVAVAASVDSQFPVIAEFLKEAAPVVDETPKTIASLITDVEAVGGHAEQIDDRLWEVFLPVAMVGGHRSDVMIGRVGFYVRDGKNHIGSSIHGIRRRLAQHC
jgi:hypothetical protein